MNLLALIPVPYRWLMLAALAAAVWGHGYVKGYEARDESADKYEAKVEAREDLARAAALTRKTDQDKNTKELTDAHQVDRNRVIRYYERRLRELPASGGSAAAERARGDDDATPKPASCGEGAQRDIAFERACALDASALIWFQEFARRNKFPIEGAPQ